MALNSTFLDTSNTIVDLITGVNQNLNNSLGIIILVIIGFALFITFQQYPIKQIMLYQGFILSILGAFLWFSGFLAFEFLLVPLMLFFIMLYFNVST